jgi:hypothetical protein
VEDKVVLKDEQRESSPSFIKSSRTTQHESKKSKNGSLAQILFPWLLEVLNKSFAHAVLDDQHPLEAPPFTHTPAVTNTPTGNAHQMNNPFGITTASTNPSHIASYSTRAQATVFKGYPVRDAAGMLLVGDLLAWTLYKHKKAIWAKCGTTGWEELWMLWHKEGAPVYLRGTISSRVRDGIREVDPWRTENQVDEKCR